MSRAELEALPVDPFLLQAVKTDSNRPFVRRVEADLLLFFSDSFRPVAAVDAPTSFHRRLIHFIAEHYRFSHAANISRPDTVLVSRMPSSIRPSVSLCDLYPMEDAPLSASLAPAASAATVSPSPSPVILLRRPASAGASAASPSSGGQSGDTASNAASQDTSIEARELEYEKARARIFADGDGGAQSTVTSAPRHTVTVTPARPPMQSSGGQQYYHQQQPMQQPMPLQQQFRPQARPMQQAMPFYPTAPYAYYPQPVEHMAYGYPQPMPMDPGYGGGYPFAGQVRQPQPQQVRTSPLVLPMPGTPKLDSGFVAEVEGIYGHVHEMSQVLDPLVSRFSGTLHLLAGSTPPVVHVSFPTQISLDQASAYAEANTAWRLKQVR